MCFVFGMFWQTFYSTNCPAVLPVEVSQCCVNAVTNYTPSHRGRPPAVRTSSAKKAVSKSQYDAEGMKSRLRRRDNYKVTLSLSRRTASRNYFIVFVDLFLSQFSWWDKYCFQKCVMLATMNATSGLADALNDILLLPTIDLPLVSDKPSCWWVMSASKNDMGRTDTSNS